MPADAWAMLVVAVDIADSESVTLFAGCREPQHHAADIVDGALVLRLGPPPHIDDPDDPTRADIELLLAYQGR
ncbi:hypothetical protein [Saccharopolyspora phatthalungensis]|uniref:Uncharacterized protein n=1 Tax=Saccharopolyspora phatthalungensis TaxID=664693 RepID=A0A840QFQ3_9PSEU|nr:hypothetical protein [Saccharopolyspora phatthalungensis]MBB5157429.1 hypothetical protein [Saccharopolyspora phatthalungensis]